MHEKTTHTANTKNSAAGHYRVPRLPLKKGTAGTNWFVLAQG